MPMRPPRLSLTNSLSRVEDVLNAQSCLQCPQDSPSLVRFSSLQMQLEKRLLPSKMRVLLENVVSVLGQKPARSTIHMLVVLSVSCRSKVWESQIWKWPFLVCIFFLVCYIWKFMTIARHIENNLCVSIWLLCLKSGLSPIIFRSHILFGDNTVFVIISAAIGSDRGQGGNDLLVCTQLTTQ